MNHQSRDELLKALFAIFPAFQAEWLADCEGEIWRSESLHSVYMSFVPFLAKIEPSEKQLGQLAQILNGAVAAGGDAENAADTSFFEALGPGPLRRNLRPLLSPAAKARLHA